MFHKDDSFIFWSPSLLHSFFFFFGGGGMLEGSGYICTACLFLCYRCFWKCGVFFIFFLNISWQLSKMKRKSPSELWQLIITLLFSGLSITPVLWEMCLITVCKPSSVWEFCFIRKIELQRFCWSYFHLHFLPLCVKLNYLYAQVAANLLSLESFRGKCMEPNNW